MAVGKLEKQLDEMRQVRIKLELSCLMLNASGEGDDGAKEGSPRCPRRPA